MSIDFDSDAKLNTLSARYTVSHAAERQSADRMVRSMAFQRIRDYLARELADSAIRVTEEKYSTDFEVRVYVLTPDQLEKYVQRRAERLGYLPSQIVEDRTAFEASRA